VLVRGGTVVRDGSRRLSDCGKEALSIEPEGAQAAGEGVDQSAHRLGARLSHLSVAQGGVTLGLDQRQFELLPLDLADVLRLDIVDGILGHAGAVSLERIGVPRRRPE